MSWAQLYRLYVTGATPRENGRQTRAVGFLAVGHSANGEVANHFPNSQRNPTHPTTLTDTIMRRRILPATLTTLLLASALPARSQVVDQSSTTGTLGLGAYLFQTISAQSFTPSQFNVNGAGFGLTCFQGNCTIPQTATISLFAGTPVGFPGGTPLASGTVSLGSHVTGYTAFYDVFWSAVGVTAGSSYFLTIQSNATTQDWAVVADPTFPYAGGQYRYSKLGGAYTPGGFPVDANFREFYDPTVTPEPASLLLLGVGLISIGAVDVRRRVVAGPRKQQPT